MKFPRDIVRSDCFGFVVEVFCAQEQDISIVNGVPCHLLQMPYESHVSKGLHIRMCGRHEVPETERADNAQTAIGEQLLLDCKTLSS